jgi:hypothetical protein
MNIENSFAIPPIFMASVGFASTALITALVRGVLCKPVVHPELRLAPRQ